MILIAFAAALFLAGFIAMAAGIRNAPEGFQNASGFNLLWCNNAPEMRNIVCIWATHSERSAFEESPAFESAA